MAARQDQGLQIALIVLIFLFILTAVAAYLGWKGYSESDQRATKLQSDLNDANNQVRTMASENEDYREMMGFNRGDNLSDIKTAYEADMKKYGTGMADQSRLFYRNVLESVFTEGQRTAEREAKAKDDLKEMTAKYEALEGQTQKQLAQYREQMNSFQQDLASLRKQFAEDQAGLETKKKELEEKLQTQRTELEGQITQRESNIKELQAKKSELERAVKNLREQLPSDVESFEVADGRISWVNQNGTVWIDVGEADALRRQITFSVYDADEHDAARAQKKGSIEVTRLLGDHMAEARITQDDPTNPILTGDRIYSPVWHRGKKLRFALTGFIDIDGDGTSDTKLARDLIELNGGELDAYVDDNGKVVGTITAHTRYLVLGEYPESALRAGMREGYDKMTQTARELGIETITLDKFLNRMGYTTQGRTVRLGEGASARDFPARAPANGFTEAERTPAADEEDATSSFRPRTPYRGTVRTPY